MARPLMECFTCAFAQPLATPGEPGWETANRAHREHDGAHYATWYDEQTGESLGSEENG